MALCANCGREVAEGSGFCGSCGAALGGGQGGIFTGLINPVLKLIDNGVIFRKGFVLLYGINAISCLLLPLIILVGGLTSGILSYMPGGVIFGLVLAWLVLTFICWLVFQVWWNRMKKIKTLLKEGDEFIATPLIADFIKTNGEFLGIVLVGIVPIIILLGIFADDFLSNFGFGLGSGFLPALLSAITTGICGYLILLGSKYISEFILALAAIANNTKKSAERQG